MVVLTWLLTRGVPASLTQALAYLLPLLLLLAALSTRRYPGEQALLRAAGFLRADFKRSRSSRGRPAPPRALMPRGTRLVAWSLAERPPPPAGALSV